MILKILGYVLKNSLWLRFDYQHHYLIFSHWKQTITSEIIHKYVFTQKRIRNEMNTAAKEDFEHASFINVLAWIESIILMLSISTTPAPKNYKLYSHHQQSIKYGKGLIYLFLSKEMVWLGSLISDIDKPLGMILTTKSVSA